MATLNEERLVTEIPSSLKQLARLVVRGFYTIDDALIVDMLVRNPCMKEDDICELLKFDRKMLRARISVLKNDKFIQVRLRMETGADGKAQKVNYYFINYKTFVNVVKYKLDLMRKRLETEERDATSRASFKCPNCLKTFTDLEADQLFDFMTSEFRCTYCKEVVEEDLSALPKKDSRLLLAKFNEQLDPLYCLLREVEGIKLAPEVLEPEPVDIAFIRGLDANKKGLNSAYGLKDKGSWSGEATRSSSGFLAEETRVDVTIGSGASDASNANVNLNRKEAPVWMVESTVLDPSTNTSYLDSTSATVSLGDGGSASGSSVTATHSKTDDDIMNVLLAHEKKHSSTHHAAHAIQSKQAHRHDSDSDDSDNNVTAGLDDDLEKDATLALLDRDGGLGGGKRSHTENGILDDDSEDMEEEDDDDDDSSLPTVQVGNKVYNITDINDAIIGEMTQTEKEIYVQVFQDYYSHISY